jgi:hypothetical protein
MQKLKCIGGECDGRIEEGEFKLHDQVRVRKEMEFKISDFSEDVKAFREGRVPDHVITQYVIYRVCAIHGTSIKGDRLKHLYLCPNDWHEWEAIMYQFGK